MRAASTARMLGGSLGVAALSLHGDELLEEEWVPFRSLDDSREHRLWKLLGPEQCGELACLGRRQRPEVEEPMSRLRCPPRSAFEQLRARRAEEQDREAARGRRHVLEQVEQGWLGPVQILELGDQRPLPGEGLEEAPHGPRRLLRSGRPLGGPDRPQHPPRDQVGPLVFAEELEKRRARVAVGEASDDVGQRPVGDAVSVGDATAQDSRRLVADALEQLAHEPGLADPRRAHHRADPARGRLADRCEQSPQLAQLGVAAHERRRRRSQRGIARRSELDRPPCTHERRSSLHGDRSQGLGANRLLDEPVSLLADENLAGLRRLLEACGDVERVSRRKRLLPRSGSRKHLPRVHADGDTQLDSALAHQHLAESCHCAACLDGRPHRAERVVLVHRRQTEEADHGVADVLLDPTAVAFHRRSTGRRVPVQDVVKRLGVEALGQLSRVGHVREDHRHRPPDSGGAVDLVRHVAPRSAPPLAGWTVPSPFPSLARECLRRDTRNVQHSWLTRTEPDADVMCGLRAGVHAAQRVVLVAGRRVRRGCWCRF